MLFSVAMRLSLVASVDQGPVSSPVDWFNVCLSGVHHVTCYCTCVTPLLSAVDTVSCMKANRPVLYEYAVVAHFSKVHLSSA